LRFAYATLLGNERKMRQILGATVQTS